jgi:cell division transport system permease protein
MWQRLSYFARETQISLRRNLLMTLAGVMTIFVSLLLVGSSLAITKFVDNGVSRWSGGVEMEVFLNLKITQSQTDVVQRALTDDPRIKSSHFVSHDEAYATYKKLNPNNQTAVEAVRPEDLPESYRVVPKDAKDTDAIANDIKQVAGVQEVSTAAKFIHQFTQVSDRLRLVLFVIAAVLLASSVFLIVNTIRLATFARRREIEVMKLVGASNWFVRIPFMAEGLVQGILGGVFAAAVVYWSSLWFRGVLKSQDNVLKQLTITNGEVVLIGFGLVVVGAVIGIVGSLFGLRKFLDA